MIILLQTTDTSFRWGVREKQQVKLRRMAFADAASKEADTEADSRRKIENKDKKKERVLC
jgi:hypothetical protein